MGEEVGLKYVDLSEVEVDLSLLKRFPLRIIHREGIFPIQQKNGAIIVATSDPFNLYPLDEVGVATGKTVVPVLASRSEINKLIKTHLGVGSETIEGLLAQAQEEEIEVLDQGEGDGSELSQLAQEPSVVKLVNEILLEALELAQATSTLSRRPPACKSVTVWTEYCILSQCRRRLLAFRLPLSAGSKSWPG